MGVRVGAHSLLVFMAHILQPLQFSLQALLGHVTAPYTTPSPRKGHCPSWYFGWISGVSVSGSGILTSDGDAAIVWGAHLRWGCSHCNSWVPKVPRRLHLQLMTLLVGGRKFWKWGIFGGSRSWWHALEGNIGSLASSCSLSASKPPLYTSRTSASQTVGGACDSQDPQ